MCRSTYRVLINLQDDIWYIMYEVFKSWYFVKTLEDYDSIQTYIKIYNTVGTYSTMYNKI